MPSDEILAKLRAVGEMPPIGPTAAMCAADDRNAIRAKVAGWERESRTCYIVHRTEFARVEIRWYEYEGRWLVNAECRYATDEVFADATRVAVRAVRRGMLTAPV